MLTTLLVLLTFAAAADDFALIGCEADLTAEFSRAPLRYGFVTDRPALTTKNLRAAYLNGLYPMGSARAERVNWQSPPTRGILFLDEVQIPRGDRKALKRLRASGNYRVATDEGFAEVIRECANQSHRRRSPFFVDGGTWITPRMIDAYQAAFDEGLAHCDVVWRDHRMVAGNYGVDVGGVYSGESMYHAEADAAKLALDHLIERLRAEGRTFLDVQQAAPPRRDAVGRLHDQAISLAVRWGAREISRDEYRRLLRSSQRSDR